MKKPQSSTANLSQSAFENNNNLQPALKKSNSTSNLSFSETSFNNPQLQLSKPERINSLIAEMDYNLKNAA